MHKIDSRAGVAEIPVKPHRALYLPAFFFFRRNVLVGLGDKRPFKTAEFPVDVLRKRQPVLFREVFPFGGHNGVLRVARLRKVPA